MKCKNCKHEFNIGTTCPYCGYDEELDSLPYQKISPDQLAFPPKPLEVSYIKQKNKLSVVGFIFSFIGLIPFVGVPFTLLSFIFALVGLKRFRKCRTGLAYSIIAIVLNQASVFIMISVIKAIIEAF